jgi:hypothetical protein
MVFNATFNNISVISWRSVVLVEETGIIVNVFTQSHHPVDPSRLSQSLGSPMPINGTHINSLYFTYWAQNRLQVSSWSWSYGTTTYHHYKVVTWVPFIGIGLPRDWDRRLGSTGWWDWVNTLTMLNLVSTTSFSNNLQQVRSISK